MKSLAHLFKDRKFLVGAGGGGPIFVPQPRCVYCDVRKDVLDEEHLSETCPARDKEKCGMRSTGVWKNHLMAIDGRLGCFTSVVCGLPRHAEGNHHRDLRTGSSISWMNHHSLYAEKPSTAEEASR